MHRSARSLSLNPPIGLAGSLARVITCAESLSEVLTFVYTAHLTLVVTTKLSAQSAH